MEHNDYKFKIKKENIRNTKENIRNTFDKELKNPMHFMNDNEFTLEQSEVIMIATMIKLMFPETYDIFKECIKSAMSVDHLNRLNTNFVKSSAVLAVMTGTIPSDDIIISDDAITELLKDNKMRVAVCIMLDLLDIKYDLDNHAITICRSDDE